VKEQLCLWLFRFLFGTALCHRGGPSGNRASGGEMADYVLASALSPLLFFSYEGRMGRRSETIRASQSLLVWGGSFAEPL